MALNRETYDAIRSASKPIEDAVDRAQNLYNKILLDGGVDSVDDHTLWRDGTASYYGNYVEINWEVSWRYGGHDEGSYEIPAKALFDDTWEQEVTHLANAVLDERNKKLRNEKASKKKKEKAQYARLKKVYG